MMSEVCSYRIGSSAVVAEFQLLPTVFSLLSSVLLLFDTRIAFVTCRSPVENQSQWSALSILRTECEFFILRLLLVLVAWVVVVGITELGYPSNPQDGLPPWMACNTTTSQHNDANLLV